MNRVVITGIGIWSCLGKNLEEVKQLSELTIMQEQEKQKILKSQNETLENQVIERTKEITEQKFEIEEKGNAVYIADQLHNLSMYLNKKWYKLKFKSEEFTIYKCAYYCV